MTKVILYSTGCPRCNVLKNKLNDKGIQYSENNSIEEMTSLGITQVPILGIGNEMLEFKEAVEWVNTQKGGE